MTTIPTQRDPLDFLPRPSVWTPAGTTGETTAARLISVANGDQVLVYKSHGYWGLSPANPEHTPRYSIWAAVIRRERRTFTVRIDGTDWPVSVRHLSDQVIRRTMPVSVHDFEPGHSGMSCVRMVVRPDGTGDACGEPVKSAIHDPAAYSAYATELASALAEWTGRSAPIGLSLETLEAFGRAAKANQEILSLAASGRADAVDLALECAFPSQPTELETMRDKVNGHLEAAEAVFSVAYARGGTNAETRARGAVDALRALKADLGF